MTRNEIKEKNQLKKTTNNNQKNENQIGNKKNDTFIFWQRKEGGEKKHTGAKQFHRRVHAPHH